MGTLGSSTQLFEDGSHVFLTGTDVLVGNVKDWVHFFSNFQRDKRPISRGDEVPGVLTGTGKDASERVDTSHGVFGPCIGEISHGEFKKALSGFYEITGKHFERPVLSPWDN